MAMIDPRKRAGQDSGKAMRPRVMRGKLNRRLGVKISMRAMVGKSFSLGRAGT
jgi:hypothetical protein